MMTRRNHQWGFSLVELLVAMTISLLVLAGVVNSFLASREANRMNDELGFIQENARYALDMLSRDVRQAGDFGCTTSAFGGANGGNNYVSRNLVSIIKPKTPVPKEAILYKGIGIQGFDHSASGSFPALLTEANAVAADALIVRRADTDNAGKRFIVSEPSGASGTLKITAAQQLEPGTFMVAADADCRHQALFQMTGPAVGASNKTIEYGGTATPGNCANTLRGDRVPASTYYKGDCSDQANWKGSISQDYLAGAALMPLKSTLYFIAPSSQDDTTNSLWVRSLGSKGSVPAAEELADGVVDMRITYAVNVNPSVSNTDIPSIVYTTANNIVADEPNTATLPPASLLVWNRVVAVRIQLLMRSRTPVLSSPQAHDYSSVFGPDYADLNDRFLYQVVSTTVAVRNVFRG